MKKNKILSLAVCICCLLFLAACKGASTPETAENSGKISIVCTTFPQYDWMCEIIGDNAERFDLTLLVDTGVDLHNYQPSAGDIARIGSADIFIYVGGESDEWTEDALKEAENTDIQAVSLLALLGDAAKEEEIVEGMQEEEEEAADEPEYDEHVWLSVKNAKVFVRALSDILSLTDTENADLYAANAAAYIEKLDDLDKQYEQAAASAKFNTLLFGDRFPFRYLADDYGLQYYAAFAGCSAETEASFETVIFLAGKADELGLDSILVIEGSDQKIAETIRQNTASQNQSILVLNSMQSVTKTDIEDGFTYLKALQDNLEILRQALN